MDTKYDPSQRHLFQRSLATSLSAMLILGLMGSSVATAHASESPSIQYAEVLAGTFDHLEAKLPAIARAAAAAAEKLVSGGRLRVSYLPDAPASANGFAHEASNRAGGLTMTSYARYGSADIGSRDVFMIDDMGLDTAQRQSHMREAQAAGALVILFGSASSPLSAAADFVIDTGLAPGTAPAVHLEGLDAGICPAAPSANITALWVFTGELVAACTRLERMPALFQSVFAPGGREWYQRYSSQYFHADMTVDPVPAGVLGSAYLVEMRRCLQGLRHQATSLQAGGQMLAAAIKAGGKAKVAATGHCLPAQFGLPGDPGTLDAALTWTTRQEYDVPRLMDELDAGDALLFIGYYGLPPWEDMEALRASGFPSVWVTGGREVADLNPRPKDWEIHIDPLWTFGDCCVQVPGYPIGILPPSGVIQTAALWMITAELEKAMRPTPTAVTTTQAAAIPQEYALLPAFPNPFNAQITVPYELRHSGRVDLAIFDLAGHRVRQLVRSVQARGAHHVRWDGRNQLGEPMASGVYLYRLRGAAATESIRKMLLLK